MKEMLGPVWDEWITDMEKRGYDAKGLIEMWKKELAANGIK